MTLERKTRLRSKTRITADPSKQREWEQRTRATMLASPPARRRVKPVSAKRSKAMRERESAVIPDGPREPVQRDDHVFREFVSRLACTIDLRFGEERTMVDPAHLKTKRVRGDWLVDPNTGELAGNIMPLSRLRHDEQHHSIQDFEARHDVDLARTCAIIGQAYRDGWTPFALSRAARVAGGYQHVDLEQPDHVKTLEMP